MLAHHVSGMPLDCRVPRAMEISSDFFAAMEGDINDQKEGKERVALSIEHRSSLVSLFIEMDLKKESQMREN